MMPLSGSESHAPRTVNFSALITLQVSDVDYRADADHVGLGIGEIGAARARTSLRFQFGFAAHENLLHFLGRFVFVIFAQITVAAGDGDFLGVGRNLFLHQFVVFVFAAFQAFPRNDQRRFLLGLLRRRSATASAG